MPSPFPGMDPYLEDPAVWPGLHSQLIACARAILNATLPAHYVANTGERLYVAQHERSIYPDVFVRKQSLPLPAASPDTGGTAVAVAGEAPWVVTAYPEEVREPFIEILSLQEGRRVVAVIEILSPANKTAGDRGRELYLTKQQEVLQSDVHLVEIDLLRRGEHTVAPPREELARRGRWDYLVSLHRASERWTYRVWPVALREPLPCIPVPLTEGDPDVGLPLQPVFDRAYDEGAYLRQIDYAREPTPLLSDEEARWADTLLREKGLRP